MVGVWMIGSILYVNSNRSPFALEFLREMIYRGLTPNIVTYNTLINGLCRAGRIREALSLFEKLQVEGIYPDAITYNTLISWHCKEGLFDYACLVLHQGVKNVFVPNGQTWFILVYNFVIENERRNWSFSEVSLPVVCKKQVDYDDNFSYFFFSSRSTNKSP
ncbi:hypothetical protein SLA2020_242370 [Shorea laevis]